MKCAGVIDDEFLFSSNQRYSIYRPGPPNARVRTCEGDYCDVCVQKDLLLSVLSSPTLCSPGLYLGKPLNALLCSFASVLSHTVLLNAI